MSLFGGYGQSCGRSRNLAVLLWRGVPLYSEKLLKEKTFARIGGKYDFRGENFPGLLACADNGATPPNFARKLSRIATKPRNSRKFLHHC